MVPPVYIHIYLQKLNLYIFSIIPLPAKMDTLFFTVLRFPAGTRAVQVLVAAYLGGRAGLHSPVLKKTLSPAALIANGIFFYPCLKKPAAIVAHRV
jgi:hypothetical protein